LRYTISPIVSRVMWPLLMTKIFGPRPVPKKFEGFPKEMALRPSQIRASAEESALMFPDALRYRDEYHNLKMPLVIVAGDEDRLVDIDAQSARLHSDVPQSRFHRVSRAGHMIHQTATGVAKWRSRGPRVGLKTHSTMEGCKAGCFPKCPCRVGTKSTCGLQPLWPA
jgi:pimeloyl-ACP methyl ester carboxylesterase